MYDSLAGKSRGRLSESLKIQLGHIYGNGKSHLQVTVPMTNQQLNYIDCGIYAIANAYSVSFGVNLNENNFDEKLMRGHVLKCFEAGIFTDFPTRTEVKALPRPITVTIDLNCGACSLPDLYHIIIEFESCRIWYHQICVSIPLSLAKQNRKNKKRKLGMQQLSFISVITLFTFNLNTFACFHKKYLKIICLQAFSLSSYGNTISFLQYYLGQ